MLHGFRIIQVGATGKRGNGNRQESLIHQGIRRKRRKRRRRKKKVNKAVL
jgi:hypothetical protein